MRHLHLELLVRLPGIERSDALQGVRRHKEVVACYLDYAIAGADDDRIILQEHERLQEGKSQRTVGPADLRMPMPCCS
eukprot:6175-Hanusia_phi.AAC.1